jgi:L-threonylcarbamoyladenylate synthase
MINSCITQRLTCFNDDIDRAGQILRQGGLVAFPTETVYGLGANGTREESVINLYKAKGRPSYNPLIAHVPNYQLAKVQGIFTKHAHILAKAYWPGPLTLVLKRAPSATLVPQATAGLETVAIRVPAIESIRHMLTVANIPIVAPSANRSGTPSATLPDHVLSDLDGQIDAIIDGGATQKGLESTILDCSEENAVYCLRPGAISRAHIERTLGMMIKDPNTHTIIKAPGTLSSHYAPRAQMRLDVHEFFPHEAALLFGDCAHIKGLTRTGFSKNLSPSGSLSEAASHLFAYLRELDEWLDDTSKIQGFKPTIAVSPIPRTELGEAIQDRLCRASAPRFL